MKRITFTRDASKALERMPAATARTILSKIRQLAADPGSLANNVKRLQGMPGFRLRVGDWRVIFTDDGSILAILYVGPRGDAYR
jgi:mRNA interferase RelE/StbE